MLNVYTKYPGRIQKDDGKSNPDILSEAIWIDMVSPSKEEELTVEAILSVEIPTPEEMRGVESSSQIYHDGDATIMTIRVMQVTSRPSPTLMAATFILTATRLVTLRYADPTPFRVFADKLAQQPEQAASPITVMIGLLEAIVDRAAEILENIGDQLDKVSERLFAENNTSSSTSSDTNLESLLQQIGRNGDLASRSRESLHSINRIVPALRQKQDTPLSDDVRERLGTLRRDVVSLLDHDAYVTSRTQFLLDSNLGLISIQQNSIIKIFSVAAVIFLPPTLVASVYGMNFEHIPELKWPYGYPFAVAMMVLSALVPYWYFKQRRWL